MKQKRLIFSLISSAVFLLNGSVWAQDPPTADVEAIHRERLWERYRIDRQIQQNQGMQPGIQISSPQLNSITLDEKTASRIFKLNEVIFDNPPQSVTATELKEIANRYISQGYISIRDVYEMIGEIDRLFDDRHVLGRAIIPVQEVVDGVLHIQVVEAKIGNIFVESKRLKYPIFDKTKEPMVSVSRPFRNFFVNKRIHFSPGDPLSVKQLEEDVLRYDRVFQSQLLAELEPGTTTGTSDLKLTVVEPQPISVGFFVDNSGRETSGKHRTGTFVQLQSLLGLDESLFVSYDRTTGNSSWFVAGEMPVTPWGTSVDVSFSRGEPETISGSYELLNITGLSNRYRLGIRQNLKNTQKHKLDITSSVESYKSTTWFDNVPNYKEKLFAYSFGFEGMQRYGATTFLNSLSFAGGDAGVAGNVAFGDESYDYANYSLLRGSLTHIWNFNEDWTWVGRFNGQVAMSDLPQSQLFQIGGVATVRGVTEALMSAESGYVASAEFRNLLTKTPNNFRMDFFGFMDHGGIYYRHATPALCSSDYLLSFGAGVLFSMGRNMSATIGFGQPIFRGMSHQDAFKKVLKEGKGFFTARIQL